MERKLICPTSHCVAGRLLLAPQEVAGAAESCRKRPWLSRETSDFGLLRGLAHFIRGWTLASTPQSKAWRTLYSQSPPALENWGWSMFKTSLLFSYARALAFTTCANWAAGDWSQEARVIFIWCLVFKIIYGLEIPPLGSQCPTILILVGIVCLSVSPLCPNTSLPEISHPADVRKKRKLV